MKSARSHTTIGNLDMPLGNVLAIRPHCRRLENDPHQGAIVISETGLLQLIGYHRSIKLPTLRKWLSKLGCITLRTGEYKLNVVELLLVEAHIAVEPEDLDHFFCALIPDTPSNVPSILMPSAASASHTSLPLSPLESPACPSSRHASSQSLPASDASTSLAEASCCNADLVPASDTSDAAQQLAVAVYESLSHEDLIALLVQKDKEIARANQRGDAAKEKYNVVYRQHYNKQKRVDKQLAQIDKLKDLAKPKPRPLDIVPAGPSGRRLALRGVLALGIRRNLTWIACADVASFMMESWTRQKVARCEIRTAELLRASYKDVFIRRDALLEAAQVTEFASTTDRLTTIITYGMDATNSAVWQRQKLNSFVAYVFFKLDSQNEWVHSHRMVADTLPQNSWGQGESKQAKAALATMRKHMQSLGMTDIFTRVEQALATNTKDCTYHIEVYVYTSDRGADMVESKLILEVYTDDVLGIWLFFFDCGQHISHLVVKDQLKLTDRFLEEWTQKPGTPGMKYFSTLTKITYCWRDHAKGMFAAWRLLFGAESALRHAATLVPKAIAIRWGSIHAVEPRYLNPGLKKVHDAMSLVLKGECDEEPDSGEAPTLAEESDAEEEEHKPNQSKTKSAKAKVKPAKTNCDELVRELVLDDIDFRRRQMGRWRRDAMRGSAEPKFECVMVVARATRGPAMHLNFFLKKKLCPDTIAKDGGHVGQLVSSKARKIHQGYHELMQHGSDLMNFIQVADVDLGRKDAQQLRNFAAQLLLLGASSMRRRLVDTTDEFPLQLLRLAESPPGVDCGVRRKLAATLVNESNWTGTARKVREIYLEELKLAAETGTLLKPGSEDPSPLYTTLKKVRDVALAAIDELERYNSIIKILGNRSPNIGLVLLWARLAIKGFLGAAMESDLQRVQAKHNINQAEALLDTCEASASTAKDEVARETEEVLALCASDPKAVLTTSRWSAPRPTDVNVPEAPKPRHPKQVLWGRSQSSLVKRAAVNLGFMQAAVSPFCISMEVLGVVHTYVYAETYDRHLHFAKAELDRATQRLDIDVLTSKAGPSIFGDLYAIMEQRGVASVAVLGAPVEFDEPQTLTKASIPSLTPLVKLLDLLWREPKEPPPPKAPAAAPQPKRRKTQKMAETDLLMPIDDKSYLSDWLADLMSESGVGDGDIKGIVDDAMLGLDASGGDVDGDASENLHPSEGEPHVAAGKAQLSQSDMDKLVDIDEKAKVDAALKCMDGEDGARLKSIAVTLMDEDGEHPEDEQFYEGEPVEALLEDAVKNSHAAGGVHGSDEHAAAMQEVAAAAGAAQPSRAARRRGKIDECAIHTGFECWSAKLASGLNALQQRATALRDCQVGQGKQISLVEIGDAAAAGASDDGVPLGVAFIHWKDPIARLGRSMPYGVRRWNRFRHFLKNVQWKAVPEKTYDGEIVHPSIGVVYKHGGDHQELPDSIGRLKVMWSVSTCGGNDGVGNVCEFCGESFLNDATAVVRTCPLCLERSHEACNAFASVIRSEHFCDIDAADYSRDIIPESFQPLP